MVCSICRFPLCHYSHHSWVFLFCFFFCCQPVVTARGLGKSCRKLGNLAPAQQFALPDQEGEKIKVTKPGMTLSLSTGSLGQLEFLESFLLDSSLLNSGMFLLVYSIIWSWKKL